MNEEAAYLVMEQGPYAQQQYLLDKQAMVIGRGPNNDIVIADAEVSRQHARILWHGGYDYEIQDLGSTNGTFVDGRRISSATPLKNGALIKLGDSVILSFHTLEPLPVDEDDTPTGEIVVPPAVPPWVAASAPVAGQSSAYRPSAAPPPAYAPPGAGPYMPPVASPEVQAVAPPRRRVHPLLLGCGVLLLTAFLCTAVLFFLDAYDNGRLLYCGALRPFWQLLLGPFGFAPLCG